MSTEADRPKNDNPKTYTVGQLVKAFKLSRSTLLYYDKINLLTPSGEWTEANYRLYTQDDFDRMVANHRLQRCGFVIGIHSRNVGVFC